LVECEIGREEGNDQGKEGRRVLEEVGRGRRELVRDRVEWGSDRAREVRGSDIE
jgi:hypothetical protein